MLSVQWLDYEANLKSHVYPAHNPTAAYPRLNVVVTAIIGLTNH